MSKEKNVWIFDRAPPSGKNRGAETISELFDGEGSLMKEDIQNAADQLRKTNKFNVPIGKIEIELSEFSGGKKTHIKQLIDWENQSYHQSHR